MENKRCRNGLGSRVLSRNIVAMFTKEMRLFLNDVSFAVLESNAGIVTYKRMVGKLPLYVLFSLRFSNHKNILSFI